MCKNRCLLALCNCRMAIACYISTCGVDRVRTIRGCDFVCARLESQERRQNSMCSLTEELASLCNLFSWTAFSAYLETITALSTPLLCLQRHSIL